MENDSDNTTGIQNNVIESIARCVLPAILSFFESEEGKREFEKWQTEQAQGRTENK